MRCGLCLRFKKSGCPRKSKILKSVFPACSKFIFNTRKVSAKILKEGLRLSTLPKSQLLALMGLLDSSLRLRAQNLTLGLSLPYTAQDETFTVYLISSPKKEEHAYGVSFSDKPRKNTVTSVMVKKKLFEEERDKKLKRIWEKTEQKLIFIKDLEHKRRLLYFVFLRMPKNYIYRMLKFGKLPNMKGKKIKAIVEILLKSYL